MSAKIWLLEQDALEQGTSLQGCYFGRCFFFCPFSLFRYVAFFFILYVLFLFLFLFSFLKPTLLRSYVLYLPSGDDE